MAFRFKVWLIGLLLIFLSGLSVLPVFAEDCDKIVCDQSGSVEKINCIDGKKACWETKISEAQNSAVTLKSTINILNGQINVLQLQIDQSLAEISALEKEIADLSDRIDGLGYSLDKLTTVLMERVAEQYKRAYSSPLALLFSQSQFSVKLSEFKYLQLARQQTAEAMVRAETQRLDYNEQKTVKEDKQLELERKRLKLEGQKRDLANKRSAQQNLLTETKNNEAIFQEKLQAVLAEYQAIQDIIAGKGTETETRHVNQGEKIASIIQGPSCNSDGTHVHFTVTEKASEEIMVVKNPFEYLRSGVSYINNTDACRNGNLDPFNPSGSWDWPISEKISLNQGYGVTQAVKCGWVSSVYRSHNGIDVSSFSSSDVKAVQSGTLFWGSYNGVNGCKLRYVRVAHDNSQLNSLYLHVNY